MWSRKRGGIVDSFREIVVVVLGAAILLLLGKTCGWLFNRKLTWSGADAPPGVDQEQWRTAVQGPGPGAALIGRLESLLVYLSVLYLGKEAAVIIGGWFAFKVASKWEVWSNVIKMPASLRGSTDLDLLRARRKLGYVMYDRFLVGTLLNVLLGAIVAAIVRRIWDIG